MTAISLATPLHALISMQVMAGKSKNIRRLCKCEVKYVRDRLDLGVMGAFVIKEVDSAEFHVACYTQILQPSFRLVVFRLGVPVSSFKCPVCACSHLWFYTLGNDTPVSIPLPFACRGKIPFVWSLIARSSCTCIYRIMHAIDLLPTSTCSAACMQLGCTLLGDVMRNRNVYIGRSNTHSLGSIYGSSNAISFERNLYC